MVQALPVSAVVDFLREVIEANEFFSDLWIVGEVSNYSRSQAGHRYFSLKDPGGVLRCVFFASKMPGVQLRDGDRVLAHGRLSIYAERGELNFVVDFVRPEGVGILAARFEELRIRLEAEGLFDPARKRGLPRFPQQIGLVTSPTGAALQDIRNVLSRRWPLAEVVFAPAMVQGEYAAGQLVAALRRLEAEPLDLVILTRGGGSSEDLHAFNDERVARAVFGFPVPVVAGVGHETDETIVDYVADVRAPTPSAAAERATPDIEEMRRTLRVFDRAMASAARGAVTSAAATVETLLRRAANGVPSPGELAHRVLLLSQGMESQVERRIAEGRANVQESSARVGALDPAATLRRGFAIVEQAGTKRRGVVNSVRRVRPGDRLIVSVADGAFSTEVS